MAEVASAFVSLLPSLKGFGGKLSSGIGPELDRVGKDGGKRFSGAMGGAIAGGASKVFAPLAAAAAAVGVGDFLKDAVAEARESQKVGAITTQIIKSTGGAAKVTADQVGALATAISNKTGVDDEAIQAGANMLLTFKNVKNEVGDGAKIFDRATQAAADLSAAGFGDMAGQSKMLGKALNDPVKGISALSRSGVTFTDQQKKQIKTLVASGKTLEAQKIILGEVESQVGGTAAASATAGEKLSVAFGNFKEQIGTALLPIIDRVAGFLTSKVIPAVSTFFSEMQSGKGAGGAFVGFLKGIWTAVQPIGSFLTGTVVPAVQGFFTSFTKGGGASTASTIFKTIAGAISGIASAIAPLIPVVVTFVTGTLVPLFQRAANFIMTQVVPAFTRIVSAVVGFVSVALPIVSSFINGMIARFQPLMPKVQAIFGTVAGIIQSVTTLISAIWSNWGQGFMNLIGSVFSAVIGIVGPALDVIKSVIQTVTSAIRGDWSGAWDGIKGIISNAWGVIKGVVSGALGILKQLFGGALGAITGAISGAWGRFTTLFSNGMSDIKTAVSNGISNVVTFFTQLPGKIVSALSGLAGSLMSAGANAVGGFIQGLASKAGEIIAVVRDKIVGVLPDFVKDFLGIHSPSTVMAALGRWAGIGFAQGLAGTSKQITSTVTKLMTGLDSLLTKTVTKVVKGKKKTISWAESVGLSRAGVAKLKTQAAAAQKALLAAATQRDAVGKRLAAAQKKLQTLQANAAKYAADAKAKVLDTGTVVGMNSFDNIIRGLQGSVAQAKSFAAAIAELRKKGLNTTSLDQIIQAGPKEGLAAAQQLLTGGSAGIKQVNALVGQLASSAGSVGTQASQAMYGAGIDAAKGLVAGLKSQKSAIEQTMTSIAAGLVKAVKAALKIKSPSRVFAQIGSFTGQGMANGISGEASSVQRAANSLVPSLKPGKYATKKAALAGESNKYQRLHPNDIADIVDGFSRSRPVATIGRERMGRDLVAGMP